MPRMTMTAERPMRFPPDARGTRGEAGLGQGCFFWRGVCVAGFWTVQASDADAIGISPFRGLDGAGRVRASGRELAQLALPRYPSGTSADDFIVRAGGGAGRMAGTA